MSASKFTPEACSAILESVSAGASIADAARAAGVREGTLKGWITRGRREPSGPYTAFAASIERARSDAQARPGQMTADEFRAQLERAVRSGSVTAMKLWSDLFLVDDDDQADAPVSPIVLLADRARRRGGADS